MTERGRLVSSVRTLCGELPDAPLSEGGLPSSLIFEELTNVEAMMLRDLDLSIQNRRVLSDEIWLTGNEESFTPSVTNFQAPTAAFLKVDSASEFWYPVELTTYEALAEATAGNRLAVAFNGATGYLSWLPDGGQVLRLWYERSDVDEPTLANDTELGNLYDEYLKTQVAAQCREYLKLPVGTMLLARLQKSERQWQRFVNRGHQRGSAEKTPVFTPPRLRRAYGIDRTRFFVP